MLGAYKELDDELILSSSVRAPSTAAPKTVSASKRRALDAKAEQDFNRDDVDELKGKGLLGEAADGTLAVLTEKITGTSTSTAEKALAATLVVDENRDRAEIWRRIIAANANLADKDLLAIRRTYAKLQREDAATGQWIQDEAGTWRKKETVK